MSIDSQHAAALRGTVADMLQAKGAVIYGIAPGDTVYDAIKRMTECRVGALVVLDEGRPVGIISERDYTRRVILLGRASKDTRVDEIMTAPLVTVEESTTLGSCLKLVTDKGIRHLPVVRDGKAIGVLSIGDLVRTVVAQQAEAIERMHSFIGSDYPN